MSDTHQDGWTQDLTDILLALNYQSLYMLAKAAGTEKVNKLWWDRRFDALATPAAAVDKDRWKPAFTLVTYDRLAKKCRDIIANIIYRAHWESEHDAIMASGRAVLVAKGKSYRLERPPLVMTVVPDVELITDSLLTWLCTTDRKEAEMVDNMRTYGEAFQHNRMLRLFDYYDCLACPRMLKWDEDNEWVNNGFDSWFQVIQTMQLDSRGKNRAKFIYLERPELPAIPAYDTELEPIGSWVFQANWIQGRQVVDADVAAMAKYAAFYGANPLPNSRVIAAALVYFDAECVGGSFKAASVTAWASTMPPIQWCVLNNAALPPEAIDAGHTLEPCNWKTMVAAGPDVVLYPPANTIRELLELKMIVAIPALDKLSVDQVLLTMGVIKLKVFLSMGSVPSFWLVPSDEEHAYGAQVLQPVFTGAHKLVRRLALRNIHYAMEGRLQKTFMQCGIMIGDDNELDFAVADIHLDMRFIKYNPQLPSQKGIVISSPFHWNVPGSKASRPSAATGAAPKTSNMETD